MGLVDSAKSAATNAASNLISGLTSQVQQKISAIKSTNPASFIGSSASQITSKLPKDGFNIASQASQLNTSLSNVKDFGGSLLSGLGALTKGVANVTSGPISFLTSGINSNGNVLSGLKGYNNQVPSNLLNGMNSIKDWKNTSLTTQNNLVSSTGSSITGQLLTGILGVALSNRNQTTTTTTTIYTDYNGIYKAERTTLVDNSSANLPLAILQYVYGNNHKQTNLQSNYDQTVAALSYTDLSTDTLSYVLQNYDNPYPALIGKDGKAITSQYSEGTYNHINSLFTLLRDSNCNLDLFDIVNFGIFKSIFDMILIDLILKGLSQLLDWLLGCNLYADDRTNLIMKDLLYDTANRGDVYTASTIVNHIDTSLVTSPNELIRILNLNSDLSTIEAQNSMNNIYNKFNTNSNVIIIQQTEYNNTNVGLDTEDLIYDAAMITALKAINPTVPNNTLGVQDTNMFLKVFDMFT
jgi:hypothetical protein